MGAVVGLFACARVCVYECVSSTYQQVFVWHYFDDGKIAFMPSSLWENSSLTNTANLYIEMNWLISWFSSITNTFTILDEHNFPTDFCKKKTNLWRNFLILSFGVNNLNIKNGTFSNHFIEAIQYDDFDSDEINNRNQLNQNEFRLHVFMFVNHVDI